MPTIKTAQKYIDIMTKCRQCSNPCSYHYKPRISCAYREMIWNIHQMFKFVDFVYDIIHHQNVLDQKIYRDDMKKYLKKTIDLLKQGLIQSHWTFFIDLRTRYNFEDILTYNYMVNILDGFAYIYTYISPDHAWDWIQYAKSKLL